MFLLPAFVTNFWLKYGRAAFDWKCHMHRVTIFTPNDYRMFQLLINYLNSNLHEDPAGMYHSLLYAGLVIGLYTLFLAQNVNYLARGAGAYVLFACVCSEWAAGYYFDLRDECSVYRKRLILARRRSRKIWRTVTMLPDLEIKVGGERVTVHKGIVLDFSRSGSQDVLGFTV